MTRTINLIDHKCHPGERMSRDTISIHFVKAALHGARQQGRDIDGLLQRAGIPPDLTTGSLARVSTEQYTRLIQLLWLEMRDEQMGFGPHSSRLGTFAMMCYSIIHCGTLRRALSRGARFYGLVTDDFRIGFRQEGDKAILSVVGLNPDHDPEHFIAESLLMIWHGLGSWLVNKRIPLLEARFAYPPPAHAEEYRALFFAPMAFEAGETAVVFSTSLLDLPIVQSETSLKDFLLTSPARLLVKLKNDTSLTAQIRQILRGPMSGDLPAFEVVAEQLHLTPQTLRRRLREEGKSYQEIKDNLRRDAAIDYLARQDMTLDEIGQALGFAETSVFHRAFKKWTGVTPGAYREQRSARSH